MLILQKLKYFICILFFLFFGFQLHAGDNVKFSTGFDFSSGDYGTRDTTEILYIPFSAGYLADNFSLKMSIPFISIKSEGSVLSADGEVLTLNDTIFGDEETEKGLGDVVITGTYYLYSGDDIIPMVDLGAKVKFGTADEKDGLGTGETDYSLFVDLTKVFPENLIFGTLGYKMNGSPSAYDLDDVFFVSLGASWKFDEDLNSGIIYDFRESATGNDDLSEMTVYGSYKYTKDYKIMLYGMVGFSDASPDWGIGASVSATTAFETVKKTIDSLRRR